MTLSERGWVCATRGVSLLLQLKNGFATCSASTPAHLNPDLAPQPLLIQVLPTLFPQRTTTNKFKASTSPACQTISGQIQESVQNPSCFRTYCALEFFDLFEAQVWFASCVLSTFPGQDIDYIKRLQQERRYQTERLFFLKINFQLPQVILQSRA